MKIFHTSDGVELREGNVTRARVCKIWVGDSQWWAALKPSRETISPEGRVTKEAALRDAFEFVNQRGARD